MQIDLSTQQVCEGVHRSMGTVISMTQVMKLWHSIGTIIRSQMEQRKGVKLDHFGSFSFDILGEPCFNLSAEFKRTYKVHQTETPSHDNSPVAKLNLTQLSRMTGLDRSVSDKAYNKFVTTVGGGLRMNKNLLITVHKVAEIFISNESVKVMFVADFLSSVGGKSPAKPTGNVLKQRPSSAPRATRSGGDVLDVTATRVRTRPSTPSGRRPTTATATATAPVASRAKKQIPRGKKLVESVMARTHNPILGDDGDLVNAPRRREVLAAFNVKRNPILNQEEDINDPDASYLDSASVYTASSRSSRVSSMLHSPRYVPASQRSGAKVQRGGAALVQENIARHNAKLAQAPRQPVEDPRSVAAGAIGPGDIVEKIKEKIIARGGVNGIKGFARLLSIMDDSGDKKLSKEELMYGLRDYGLTVSKTELEQLFLVFDRDKNGFIDVDEFLIGIRGELNPRRKRLIKMAFDILDTDGSGLITVDEMNAKYDVSFNPEVQQGKITAAQAMKQFMRQWDRLDGDGMVSVEEFEDYYKGVSSSIDDDDYFELMIRNAWRIAGGEGMAANTANKRVLVTNKDGTQRVVTVNNELGMKGGDVDAVRRRLAEQGISGGAIELHGGVDSTDKQKGRPRHQGAVPAAQRGAQMRAPRPVAKEAWGEPTGGDESFPPESDDGRGGGGGGGGGRREGKSSQQAFSTKSNVVSKDSSSRVVDSFGEILRLAFYDPPASAEQLAAKLKISFVGTPQITKVAFMQRLAHLNSNLSKPELAAIWTSVAVDCGGSATTASLTLDDIHQYFGRKFGKDKTSKSKNVIDRVIAKIMERCGGGGLKGLQRTLAIMDDNGDKRLSKEELKNGLRDYGIDLNQRELDDVYMMFDRDRNGFIDLDEFFIGIKGDLNDRRKRLVRMAFDTLDTDCSGYITVDEMNAKYDVSCNPEVQQGKKTAKEAMQEFMRQWDRLDGDGMVSVEEFEDYYKGVSSSIDGDDYFELMIRNAWRIAGGEGMAANTANKRVLVTNKDGTQRVVTVNNELGMKGGDVDAVRRRLAEQGISGGAIELHGGVDSTDKPKRAARQQQAPQRQQVPQRQQQQQQQQQQRVPPAHERHHAAEKLSAAFRGHKARKEVEYKKRVTENARQQEAEYEAEAHKEASRKILRPKGKSYSGF